MLHIAEARIDCRYVGETTPQRGAEVLDRVLQGLRRDLPAVLAHSQIAGDGIAYVERLAIDARIDLAWPDAAIARAIATDLVESVRVAIDAPATVRFADETERLARFLVDLADGAGFARGWHGPFDGLRLVPTSGVVRALVQRDAGIALAALGRLSSVQRRRIIALLVKADADRALAALLTGGGMATRHPVAIARALIGAGVEATGEAFATTAPMAIAFVAALYADGSGVADDATMRIAAALLVADRPAADAAARRARADARALLAELDATACAEALTLIAAAAPAADACETPHGGVWLLLPHLLELCHAPAAVFVATAMCAGPAAQAVWRDGSLRDALSVQPDDKGVIAACAEAEAPSAMVARQDIAQVRAAMRALDLSPRATRTARRLAIAAFRRYARRLPGFADASLPHLWRNLLATPGRVVVGDDLISVTLAPPPLAIVWRLSGADRADYVLPDGRRVRVAAAQ